MIATERADKIMCDWFGHRWNEDSHLSHVWLAIRDAIEEASEMTWRKATPNTPGLYLRSKPGYPIIPETVEIIDGIPSIKGGDGRFSVPLADWPEVSEWRWMGPVPALPKPQERDSI